MFQVDVNSLFLDNGALVCQTDLLSLERLHYSSSLSGVFYFWSVLPKDFGAISFDFFDWAGLFIWKPKKKGKKKERKGKERNRKKNWCSLFSCSQKKSVVVFVYFICQLFRAREGVYCFLWTSVGHTIDLSIGGSGPATSLFFGFWEQALIIEGSCFCAVSCLLSLFSVFALLGSVRCQFPGIDWAEGVNPVDRRCTRLFSFHFIFISFHFDLI